MMVSVEFETKLNLHITRIASKSLATAKGGNVQVGAEPGNLDSDTKAKFRLLDLDGNFAVIHDEPYMTIVWDSGEYRGTIVNATLEKLEEGRRVAATYNLEIYTARMDNHGSFDLRLREAHVSN